VIYLISQMILALAVAIVLGMALGWLLHRVSHTRESHHLKQIIAKLKARLAQAQSEVAMLSDDYDEMHRQTQDQLIALREENRQIPTLSSNLEKSQLLVRQMMQRHESKVQDLSTENRKLASKLAKIEAQEQTRNQLAAGLDERRRQSAENQTGETEGGKSVSKSPLSSENSDANNKQPDKLKSDAPTSTHLSSDENGDSQTSQPPRFVAAESDADPFDQVMEVADELQRELDLTAERKPSATQLSAGNRTGEADANHQDSQGPSSDNEVRLHSDSNRLDELNLMAVRLDADAPEATYKSIDLSELSQDTSDADDLDNLIDLDDIGDLTDPQAHDNTDDQTNDPYEFARFNDALDSTGQNDPAESPAVSVTQEKNAGEKTASHDHDGEQAGKHELALDGGSDKSTLFVPVDQHDDLQQIFGIGPLTEQALNELGITSYSQLAELKHHEIQRIADALNIGPGRIERDNWVGNARRQLEEVLEQL